MMNKTNTALVTKLERAYAKALRTELRAVDALPEKATEKQYARCWALAAATNRALEVLNAARATA